MIPTYTQIVHLDYESFFTREFSLTKMPTVNYVRDPRFKVLGCAVAIDDGPHTYLTHEEFLAWSKTIDWSTTAVSAFNCAFDGMVLTQHYGIFPAYYICTKSVAKALLPIDKHNLKTVAPALGLGEKGDALVMGATENTQALAEYACLDNELSRGIYKTLYPLISKDESDLIHLTIRQSVEPTLELDLDVLKQVRDDAIQEREAAIVASGVPESVLTSNTQFAAHIRSLGLTPPTKLSPATGEETEAFSKLDSEFIEFMTALPQYRDLWEGRLAAKSNINIRRAERFLSVAELGKTMPMPLNYCGAHTGRWSSADGFGAQNIPNLRKSNLRKALLAPKGYVIGVADLSQIELRVNAWQAGATEILDYLRNGNDVYIREAAAQYNKPESEVTKLERAFGKAVVLGCGYGLGGAKFKRYCAAGPLGMDPIILSDEEAFTSIATYRANNPEIVQSWNIMSQMLQAMTMTDCNLRYGPLTFRHQMIELPSGRVIQYPGLTQTEDNSWICGLSKKTLRYLHGPLIVENITQALARDIVAKQMLEIEKEFRVVSSTHDEVIFLIPESQADAGLQYALDVMSVTPDWAEGLPLSAEGGYDYCYSK